jgi:hypothetical protein
VPTPRSSRGWRAVALTLAGLGALFVLSSRPVAEGPTFAAEQPERSEPIPPKTPAKTAPDRQGRDASPTRQATEQQATAPPQQATPRSAAPSEAAPPPPTTGRGGAVPGGGYVFGADGRLVVASDGTTITGFEATTSCGAKVRFGEIPLSASGRFAAEQAIERNGRRIVVTLSGHVAGPGLIRGNLTAPAPGCSEPVLRYAARLS